MTVMSNISQQWALLRLWHLEAMETVIADPGLVHFTRTSYLSAPIRWRALPMPELASRVEQVLAASYKLRGWELRTPDDPWSLVPFAFYFEWVDREDIPANPDATSDPFMYPCADANPVLSDLAIRDLDKILQDRRPGIAARCYQNAFSTFRIDEDDTWHLVDYGESEALFRTRYEADPP